MWLLEKDVTISCSHRLQDYIGACHNLHGHNWKITIYCRGYELNEEDMLIDFKKIKEAVNKLDHHDLNEIMKIKNPTAEKIAQYLQQQIPLCYKVLVEEQEGSRCIYVDD